MKILFEVDSEKERTQLAETSLEMESPSRYPLAGLPIIFLP